MHLKQKIQETYAIAVKETCPVDLDPIEGSAADDLPSPTPWTLLVATLGEGRVHLASSV